MITKKLYNLDEGRTEIYTQSFTLTPDSKGKIYLDHIPLHNTLNIINTTLGRRITLVDSTDDIPDDCAYFDYREDYDYVAAKGVLIFNSSYAEHNYEFSATYVPVASRIDAAVINELLDFANKYDENIWTKEDLYNPNKNNIVAWEAINNRPELATEETDGLLSKEDKHKLNLYPENFVAPLTKLQFNNKAELILSAPSWGDNINISLGTGLDIVKTSGVSAMLNLTEQGVRQKAGLTNAYLAALSGATGDDKSTLGPSASNKYVLDQDIRLSDYRHPLAHSHNITDVINLEEILNEKSLKGHTHRASEITGMEEYAGKDGENATIEIDRTITGAPGTEASVENISSSNTHAILRFTIPKGADGAMRWEDLTPEQKEEMKIVGDKGDTGDPAWVKVNSVTTGDPGTDVKIESAGNPTQEYIAGEVYRVNSLNFTIPRGDKGETGIPAATILGKVTTSENNMPAKVVASAPTLKEIDGVLYNVTTVDFELPRGPRGTASASKITFAESNPAWSDIDDDENYTLTISAIGAVPVTMAYEDLGNGVYEEVIATVRFDYNNIYIICDHKFSGVIYVEGVA